MNGVMGALILLFAIVTMLAFGIFTAYALIIGILHSLAPRTDSAISAARILVPSQTHASGD